MDYQLLLQEKVFSNNGSVSTGPKQLGCGG
jgi:hypothetical protein